LFNLKISDLYLMLPRIAFADERRDKDLELFRGLLPFAGALSVDGITVSPGLAQPDDADAAFDRTVASLREMTAAAHEAGLAISIEPHMDSLASTPEMALKLLNAVPNLKLTLDWAELTCQGIAHEAILPLLPHTRHIQIRQAARGQLQTTFERGRIDLPRVVRDVIEAGYDGVICTEVLTMPGRHGAQKINPLTESARLRDALREARDGG
jgi:sugar phosphate isomerase/epimerase